MKDTHTVHDPAMRRGSLILTDSNDAAARSVITAAAALGGTVDVMHIEGMLAEQIAPGVAAMGAGYQYILTAATNFGKDVLPRIAALLDAPQISEVVEIVDGNTFKRPIYAGNALETVRVNAPLICITIRQSAFAKAEHVPAANISLAPATTTTALVRNEITESARPKLGAARVVVAGGRGVGSAEGFRKLEALADRLGAAIGASRAAVDAGFAANDCQVGQTGKVVAPDLYIAVGISGAIQHVAGMKDSKVIVAVNRDENAPIFEIADYAVVGDWEPFVTEFSALL